MKEQIEEMAKALMNAINEKHCHTSMRGLAEALYNAGYRKQKEGRWVHKLTHSRSIPVSCDIICDQCCNSFYRFVGMNYKYCPKCGAKMRGGAE